MKKHSVPSSPTKRSQEAAAKKKLPAHGSNVPHPPPGPFERSPVRERTRKIPLSTEIIPRSDEPAHPTTARPALSYIPEDVSRELDALFPSTQRQAGTAATQQVEPPPSVQTTTPPQFRMANDEEPPVQTQPHTPHTSTYSEQEASTLLQGIRPSMEVQKRVELVTQRACERIGKTTRQWLSLQANEHKLTQLKSAGQVPKTMRAAMPIPVIQTLGISYVPSETMRTTWETAHVLLFDEFLVQHHEALAEKQQELMSMLPKLEEEDLDRFKQLVLQSQDDILSKEIPSSSILLSAVATAYHAQLESAFVNYFYEVRAAMVEAFNTMKKRSASVREYLQRHQTDEGMSTAVPDEPLTPTKQIEDLTSQIASLRASLSDTRNQIKQMKTQKRGGRKNDEGRSQSNNRDKVNAQSKKRSNKDSKDAGQRSSESKTLQNQSGQKKTQGQKGTAKPQGTGQQGPTKKKKNKQSQKKK